MRRVIPAVVRGALAVSVLLIVTGGVVAMDTGKDVPDSVDPTAAAAEETAADAQSIAGHEVGRAEARVRALKLDAEEAGNDAMDTVSVVEGQAQQTVSESFEPVRDMLDQLDQPPAAGTASVSSQPASVQAAVVAPLAATPTWVVVAAAGAMGGAFVTSLLLSRTLRTMLALPLLSRISRSEIFDNDARRLVAQLVQATPGLCLNDMVARTGYSRNAVSYHLFVLEKEEELVSIKDGKYRRYFPRGGRYVNGAKNVVSALRNDVTLRMAQHVVANPGAIQRELCRTLGTTPSAACWHAKRLENLGVIRKERVANTVQYYPGPALVKYDLSEFDLPASLPVAAASTPTAVPAS